MTTFNVLPQPDMSVDADDRRMITGVYIGPAPSGGGGMGGKNSNIAVLARRRRRR